MKRCKYVQLLTTDMDTMTMLSPKISRMLIGGTRDIGISNDLELSL